MSADLADSTNISGFAKGFDGAKDLGCMIIRQTKRAL